MTAHKELFDALWHYKQASADPEMTPQLAAEEANHLIDAFRAEVLREAAARIDAEIERQRGWAALPGMQAARDAIDPDKAQREGTASG